MVAEWGIPFNRPSLVGNELSYLERAARGLPHLDGRSYTDAASRLLRDATGAQDVLLTTSCTAALEMSALLLDIRPGDAVVVPSFTFVTTALAFARAGASIRFADVDPGTLCIDPDSVAPLLDESVRAIVPVHYGGAPAPMEALARLAAPYGIPLVADNAHGTFSRCQGRPICAAGRFSALSFHSTKNFTCGEGGALVVNDPADVDRARVVHEKGTNRRAFLSGDVDRYSWIDTGSSFALAEMLAAHLLGQLEARDRVLARRQQLVARYERLLTPFAEQLGFRVRSRIEGCDTADHLFYVLLDEGERRDHALAGLAAVGIRAASHYVPLHDSVGAATFVDRRVGTPACPVTTSVSARILRLPLFYELADAEVDRVVEELVKLLSR